MKVDTEAYHALLQLVADFRKERDEEYNGSGEYWTWDAAAHKLEKFIKEKM